MVVSRRGRAGDPSRDVALASARPASRALRPVRPLAAQRPLRTHRLPRGGTRRARRRGPEGHRRLRPAFLGAAPPPLPELELLAPRPSARARRDRARLPDLRALRALVPRRRAGTPSRRREGPRGRAGGRGGPAGGIRPRPPAPAANVSARARAALRPR